MKKLIFIVIFLLSNFVSSIEASTVGLWLFDEVTGDIAYDSSGYGNHGTIYGGATRSTDTPFVYEGNRSIGFDGLDDYINCGNDLSFDLTDAFTLEAWVKVKSIGYKNFIVDKHYVYGLRFMSNTLYPYGYAYPQGVVESETQLSLATWAHVGTTFNGDVIRVYINGQETGANWDPNGLISTSLGSFFIGRYGSWAPPGGGYFFDGLIDEVRVSDVALSPEQMGYNHSFIPEPSSLLLLGLGLLGTGLLRRKLQSCRNLALGVKAAPRLRSGLPLAVYHSYRSPLDLVRLRSPQVARDMVSKKVSCIVMS